VECNDRTWRRHNAADSVLSAPLSAPTSRLHVAAVRALRLRLVRAIITVSLCLSLSLSLSVCLSGTCCDQTRRVTANGDVQSASTRVCVFGQAAAEQVDTVMKER